MWRWLAWRVPKRLAYWCTVRVGTFASCGEYCCQDVTNLTFIDALKRWEM